MKVKIDRKAMETALKISPKPKKCILFACGKSLQIRFPCDTGTVERYVPCDVTEEGGAVFSYAALGKLQKWTSRSKLCDLIVEGTPENGYSASFSGTRGMCRFACESEMDELYHCYYRRQEICEVKLSALSAIVQLAKEIYDDNAYRDAIAVRPSANGTTLIWTDGYSMHTANDECAALLSEQILLPVAAAQAIVKYADAGAEYVALGHTGARTEGVAVSFNAAELEYPDVSAVLSLEQPTAFRITVAALKCAIKQVSSCLRRPLIFRIEKDKLYLVAYDSGKGKKRWEDCARAEAWARVFDQRGPDAGFCLDYAYVKAALAKADGVVEISCTDKDSPVRFHFEDTGIDTVIMPMEDDFVWKSV